MEHTGLEASLIAGAAGGRSEPKRREASASRRRADEALEVEMNRSEINRALAKAIAYKQCGKDEAAAGFAIQLIELLECAEILKPAGWARIEGQLADF